MKRTVSILFCSFMLLSIFLTGCGQSQDLDNETVIISNQEFEVSNTDWTPYINESYDGEYYLYNDGSNTIFAKGKNNELFDGVIYHNTNDVYPDISMTDKIDKIILETDNEQITLDDDISLLICNELNIALNSTNLDAAIADLSKEDIFVNVYYKDYPAYQTEFMICLAQDGSPGVMFCETSRNTKMFGENNMMLFSNEKLTEYINSLY